jgi:hypothetical protein
LIKNISIHKKLGEGKQGKVFLGIDHSNNKYAIKISKSRMDEGKRFEDTQFGREIIFAKKMYDKYPDIFLKLYDYEINYEVKDHSLGFNKNKHYSMAIWSLIDLTLRELINSWSKFNKEIYYDLFIQIMYCMYLINNEGYTHRDFKTENIGLIYTDNKHIHIFGENIPTHGYHVKIIDYGKVIKSHYGHDGRNDIYFMFNRPCNSLLYNLVDNGSYNKNYVQCKLEQHHVDKIKKYFYDQNDKHISKKNLEYVLEYSNYNTTYDKFPKNKDQLETVKYLYKVINIDDFKKDYSHDANINSISVHFMISINKLLYMIENDFNIRQILKFLIKNKH